MAATERVGQRNAGQGDSEYQDVAFSRLLAEENRRKDEHKERRDAPEDHRVGDRYKRHREIEYAALGRDQDADDSGVLDVARGKAGPLPSCQGSRYELESRCEGHGIEGQRLDWDPPVGELDEHTDGRLGEREIGRASCRERVQAEARALRWTR